MRIRLFVALLLMAPVMAQAADPSAFIESYAKEHRFSGSILVQEKGKVVYAGSFGLASLAFKIPTSRQTPYKIASITKAFTAVLVLQLQEQGKLDLQRPIRTYLPDYAGEGGDRITVHQLLNHTSGLPNFDTVTDAAAALTKGLPTYQTPYTSDQLLSKFCSGKPVHAPGAVFDYNNCDYIVLGKIVERVSGMQYGQLLQENILRPLGMKHTGLLRQGDIIDGLAETYFQRDSSGKLTADLPVYPENWYAAGAMYSTVDDLLKFSDALFGSGLISDANRASMIAPGLDDYGYGVWSYDTKMQGRKVHVVKRPGRIMGAQTQLFHVLEPDVTVILLGNTDTTDTDELVSKIAKQVIVGGQ
jgi:CubicO group peptidase (beta-lactamase class C family)